MRTAGLAPLALLVGGAATVANGCDRGKRAATVANGYFLRGSAIKGLAGVGYAEISESRADEEPFAHRNVERHSKAGTGAFLDSLAQSIEDETSEARHQVAVQNLVEKCHSEMTKYGCRIGFKPAECLQNRAQVKSEICQAALMSWFFGEPTRVAYLHRKAEEDGKSKSHGENFPLDRGSIKRSKTFKPRADLGDGGMYGPFHSGEGPHETSRRGHSQHHGGPPPKHHGGPPPQHHGGPPPRHHGRFHPQQHGGPPPRHHGHHRGEDMVGGRPPRSFFSVPWDWISGGNSDGDSESSDSSDESSHSSPSIDASSDSADSSEADNSNDMEVETPLYRRDVMKAEKRLANIEARQNKILSRRDQHTDHQHRIDRDQFQQVHDIPLAESLLRDSMAGVKDESFSMSSMPAVKDESFSMSSMPAGAIAHTLVDFEGRFPHEVLTSSQIGAVSNNEAHIETSSGSGETSSMGAVSFRSKLLHDRAFHHNIGQGREDVGGRFHDNSHHDHLRYRNQFPDDYEDSRWFEDSFEGDMDCDFLQGLLAFFFFVGAFTLVLMPFVLFARALKGMVRGHVHRSSASFSAQPGSAPFAFGDFVRRSHTAEAAAPEGYQPLPEEASPNTQDSDDEAVVVTGTPVNPPPSVNI